MARPCSWGPAASDEPVGNVWGLAAQSEELSELFHCLSQKRVVNSFLETLSLEKGLLGTLCAARFVVSALEGPEANTSYGAAFSIRVLLTHRTHSSAFSNVCLL